jgi:hypothetical protein
MNRRFHGVIRDLHLYVGLFGTPFVLLFATSVFFLVHTWLPRITPESSTTRGVTALSLPTGLQTLSGRPLIDALRPVLEAQGVHGEVGFIRHQVNEGKMIIPVTIPGRQTTVTLDLTNREATIVSRETGLADAMAILHRSPGEHAPAIRMNWFYMQAWRWMADTTAYGVLFITLSGIYLWYVLRAERRVGHVLILAGGVTFFGLAYALSH